MVKDAFHGGAEALGIWMAVILSGLSWGMSSYGNIVWMSTMQERTPATLLGRVSSIDWLFTLALAPLGTSAPAPPLPSSASGQPCSSAG